MKVKYTCADIAFEMVLDNILSAKTITKLWQTAKQLGYLRGLVHDLVLDNLIDQETFNLFYEAIFEWECILDREFFIFIDTSRLTY